MPKKLLLEDAHMEAKKHNGICLSDVYFGITTKMHWKCSRGHKWKSTFKSVRAGHWCPMCSRRKYILNDVKQYCKNNGLVCHSTKYEQVNDEITVECKNGHIFTKKFKKILSSKYKCRECYFDSMCDSIDNARSLAKSFDGKCMDIELKRSRDRLLWKCKLGHLFRLAYYHVKKGHWCRKCAGTSKLSIDVAQTVAIKKEGKCLSKKYIGVDEHLEWMCKKGHVWNASLSSVKSLNTWCPYCAKAKYQMAVYETIKNKLHQYISIEYNYKGFEWLVNDKTGRQQEIDIVIKDDKHGIVMGIEYDGKQHFEPVRFNGMSIEKAIVQFQYTKKMDKMKNKKVAQNVKNMKYFIRISYNDDITEQGIFKILKSAMEEGDFYNVFDI